MSHYPTGTTGTGYPSETFEGYTYLIRDDVYYTGCRRCQGSGHYLFNGHDDLCYACRGDSLARLGRRVGTRQDAERHAHRRATAAAKRREKAQAEMRANLERLAQAQAQVPADVADLLRTAYAEGSDERSGFVLSLAQRFHQYRPMVEWGGLTDAQIAGLRKVIEDRATARAAADALPPVNEGRVQIEGEVVSVKTYNGDYGLVFKMLVQLPTAHKVFGTIPSALLETRTPDELVGAWVRLTATVERSARDHTFGIFKRPTGAEVVR